MSNQTPPKRRDEQTSLSASHLSTTATKKEDDEDEDWGDVPQPKNPTVTVAPKSDLDNTLEDDLEKELATEDEEDEEDEDEEDEEDELVTSKEPVETINTNDALRQIESLQSNLPTLMKAMQVKLDEIQTSRKRLDEDEKNFKSRINFLRVLNGESPLEEEDEPVAPLRRRRGRPAASITGGGTQTTAGKEDEDDDDQPTVGRPRGRKRPKNDQTLKQAICNALLEMTHPTNGKQYTGSVNDITAKVMLPKEKGGQGYLSTSGKPTNTVRIQMYRLEDEGKVSQNEDMTYSLRKRTVREMTGEQPA